MPYSSTLTTQFQKLNFHDHALRPTGFVRMNNAESDPISKVILIIKKHYKKSEKKLKTYFKSLETISGNIVYD